MARKEFVREMFDNISPTYDKLNHILSLNVDRSWRRMAVACAVEHKPQRVLDVACGTGDFSVALARAGVGHVVGIDISEGMMEVGRRKVADCGLTPEQVTMQAGDCEALPFADGTFDAVTVAFGVRNFAHLPVGLSEMLRVVRRGGRVVILELSVPQNPLLRWLYKLYFLHVLPFFGGLISGNRAAYRYLPASVMAFPKPDVFCGMMRAEGYADVECRSFTFGLCRMYVGTKK